MAEAAQDLRTQQQHRSTFSNGGEDDKVRLQKIVQALARQQARRDHELMKQNETSRDIR
jgi:hypothetical protein